jgi:CheY-like chemotaxis protein
MMQEAAKVLVVEDEVGSRLTLCGILEDAGYEVTGVEKGTEALDVIRDGNFNVIITDIRLPDGEVEILPNSLHKKMGCLDRKAKIYKKIGINL